MRSPTRRVRVALVVVIATVLGLVGGVATTPAHASGAPLIPTFDCVYTGDPHGPLAFLGYDNQDALAVAVPVGKKNFLQGAPTAGPKDLGQPTNFAVGTVADAFAIGLSSDPTHTMTWTLEGTDGVQRHVTVNVNSPACGSPPFIPSVLRNGGAIGSKVTKEIYQPNQTDLEKAKIKFVVVGLATLCVGGGVPEAPSATWYVSSLANGFPKGTIVHLGTPPNDRNFAKGHGKLTILDSQSPPLPPYTSIGASYGWVAADVVPRCNLGNGVVFTGASVPLPKPPNPHSDAAPYCFITDTSVSPQVTKPGVVTTPLALGDCPDATTSPGGGIRWR